MGRIPFYMYLPLVKRYSEALISRLLSRENGKDTQKDILQKKSWEEKLPMSI